MEPEPPQAIEWHRVDATRRARWLLALAALLVTGGAMGIGTSFSRRLPEMTRNAITFTGIGTMLVGLTLGVGLALAMMEQDAYCAVREDGILLHFGRAREELVPWEKLERIEHARDAVRFGMRGGEWVEWKAGGEAGAKRLAERLGDLKVKAAHGLLPR